MCTLADTLGKLLTSTRVGFLGVHCFAGTAEYVYLRVTAEYVYLRVLIQIPCETETSRIKLILLLEYLGQSILLLSLH